LHVIPEGFVKLETINGKKRNEAKGKRGRGFREIFGPLPRVGMRGERLRIFSESERTFYPWRRAAIGVLERLKG
jgi:hypothetical protein